MEETIVHFQHLLEGVPAPVLVVVGVQHHVNFLLLLSDLQVVVHGHQVHVTRLLDHVIRAEELYAVLVLEEDVGRVAEDSGRAVLETLAVVELAADGAPRPFVVLLADQNLNLLTSGNNDYSEINESNVSSSNTTGIKKISAMTKLNFDFLNRRPGTDSTISSPVSMSLIIKIVVNTNSNYLR